MTNETAPTKMYPHPKYRVGREGLLQGTKCQCGGIMYWHATVEGGGCEDCPCPGFAAL